MPLADQRNKEGEAAVRKDQEERAAVRTVQGPLEGSRRAHGDEAKGEAAQGGWTQDDRPRSPAQARDDSEEVDTSELDGAEAPGEQEEVDRSEEVDSTQEVDRTQDVHRSEDTEPSEEGKRTEEVHSPQELVRALDPRELTRSPGRVSSSFDATFVGLPGLVA